VGSIPGVGTWNEFGKGPPVLILSSPLADPSTWCPPFVSALTTAGFRAITFVHEGSDYEAFAVVRDVVIVAEQNSEKVRLLGWSQGAAIAQEVALIRPDLVTCAALIATYGRQNRIDRLLQDAWQAFTASGADLTPAQQALMLLTSYPPQTLGDDRAYESLANGVVSWALSSLVGDKRRRASAFIASYQDRLQALSAIDVPCLVMGFELDADTFAERVREVAEAIPSSRYVELAGAGHLTPVTDPQTVIQPVLEFFSEVG